MATKTHTKHKHKNNNLTSRRVSRDVVTIAKASALDYSHTNLLQAVKPYRSSVLKRLLNNAQDYRFYNPDVSPVPLTVGNTRARVIAHTGTKSVRNRFVINDSKPINTFSPKISFAVPRRTAECVRRQIRKEVLFAKGVGGNRTRKPTYTDISHISCKG